MKRTYSRLQENGASSRRAQLYRSTMRQSIREAEDDENEDIELEADATEFDGEEEAAEDGDLAGNIIALVKQAVDEGVVTADDVIAAIQGDDAEEEGEEEDAGEEDFGDEDLEESTKANRAKRIAEAKARIAHRKRIAEAKARRANRVNENKAPANRSRRVR